MSSRTHSVGGRTVKVEATGPLAMMGAEYVDAALPLTKPTNVVTLRPPLRVTDVVEWLRYATNEEGLKLLHSMIVQLDPAPWKLAAASLRRMLAHLPAGVTEEQHQALQDMMDAASRYHRTLCRHARAEYEKSRRKEKASHPLLQEMDGQQHQEKKEQIQKDEWEVEDEEKEKDEDESSSSNEADVRHVASRIGAELREARHRKELMGGLPRTALQSNDPLPVTPLSPVNAQELDQLSTRIERLHAAENLSLRELAHVGGMIEQAKVTALPHDDDDRAENPANPESAPRPRKRRRDAAGMSTVWDELTGLRSLPLSRCEDAVRLYHLARRVPNVLFTKLRYTTLVRHVARLLEYIATAPREEQELWGYYPSIH